MKVALITGGQPRFSGHFLKLLEQIKGFETADIYMNLWEDYQKKSDEFNFEDLKIPKSFTIKKIVKQKEPLYNDLIKRNAEDVNLRNTLEKIFKQFYSLTQSFDLIDEKYDCYIRFRLDGMLDRNIHLEDYNLDWGVFTPYNMRYGESNLYPLINDQFAIGNFENMKVYFSTFDKLDEYFIDGISPIHPETVLSCNLTLNDVLIQIGNFKHLIKGRRLTGLSEDFRGFL
jgi:hypothetical protein